MRDRFLKRFRLLFGGFLFLGRFLWFLFFGFFRGFFGCFLFNGFLLFGFFFGFLFNRLRLVLNPCLFLGLRNNFLLFVRLLKFCFFQGFCYRFFGFQFNRLFLFGLFFKSRCFFGFLFFFGFSLLRGGFLFFGFLFSGFLLFGFFRSRLNPFFKHCFLFGNNPLFFRMLLRRFWLFRWFFLN